MVAPTHTSERTFIRLLATSLWILCLARTAAAAGAENRSPAPSDPAQEAAEKLVQSAYAAEFRDKTPAGRKALAAKLLDAAGHEPDPANRFVLCRDARDAAVEAGDLDAAFSAIDALAGDFAIDPPGQKTEALLKVAGRPDVAAKKAAVAERALDLLADLWAAGRYPAAAPVAAAAEQAAAASNDPELLARVKALSADLKEARSASDAAEAAARKLKADPNDPHNNLTVGAFDCFTRNDWEAGVPLLAKGSDPLLRGLAARDLSAPAEPRGQFDLAGAWWDAAEKQSGRARSGCRARAATWYAKAKPGLSGLTADLAGKRIAEAGPPAAATAAPARAGAIDLLAMVEVPRDVLRGDWKLQDGVVSVTHASDGHTPSVNLYFPYHPPDEYDYTLEFSLSATGGDLIQGMSRRGDFFYYQFLPGSKTGFTLGGFNPPPPHPAQPLRLEPGHRYVSRVEVRNNAVRLYVDGRLTQTFKTDYRDAGNHRSPKTADISRPGVAVINNTLTVYRAQVVEVSGKGEVVKEDIKKTISP